MHVCPQTELLPAANEGAGGVHPDLLGCGKTKRGLRRVKPPNVIRFFRNQFTLDAAESGEGRDIDAHLPAALLVVPCAGRQAIDQDRGHYLPAVEDVLLIGFGHGELAGGVTQQGGVEGRQQAHAGHRLGPFAGPESSGAPASAGAVKTR